MEAPALLTLSKVVKTYGLPGSEATVLKETSITVRHGETIAIVGPSGSGKSTLLNLMGTLDQPSSGTIQLDGQDVLCLPEKELARVRNQKIGFIFQLHHLLPQCTVLENVLIPAAIHPERASAEERGRKLLERVGLAPRIGHRPGELSGGEQQRVAVVRALINQPRILLADEPTGSLDRQNAEQLCNLLLELNEMEGTALVMVTHAPHLAEPLGRTLKLVDGHLVAN